MKGFRSLVIRVALVAITMGTTALACSSSYSIWMTRSKSADRLYRFVRGWKAGYIDQTGKVVIAPTFPVSGLDTGAPEFHDGLLAIDFDGIYFGRDGKRAIKEEFFRGWDFSEGLAVAIPKGGDKFGYIDTTGRFVISPRFAGSPGGYVDSFSGGFAKIEVQKKIGYIDKTGEFVIPPRFFRGRAFSDGMAVVVAEGPCVYVDEYSPCPDIGFTGREEEIVGEPPLCKYTFIDSTGRVISKERYDAVFDFNEGTAPVRVGDRWGYIDKTGTMVIAPQFQEAAPFSDGLARVKSGSLFGYIDPRGNFAIPAQFKNAGSFSEGLADVTNEALDQFWYITKDGKPAMNGKKYPMVSHFQGGLAHVRLPGGKKYAYIDRTGKEVFTYQP